MRKKNILGYMANVSKSVSYVAKDKVKEVSPSIIEFGETNSELFRSLYSGLTNYKITYQRGMDTFKKSKIYEASDILKKNLLNDIKTGNFYNPNRETDSMGIGGDFNDLDFDGFDNINWEDDTDDSISLNKSKKDSFIAGSIDKSNRVSAGIIAEVTARTGEYVAESQMMNTNILYTQHLQTQNILTTGFTNVTESVNSLINISNNMMSHFKRVEKYYDDSMKHFQDQTALLREIHKSLTEPEKVVKDKKTITYDDITLNGIPDLKVYLENIKQNIKNNSTIGAISGMNSMFGDDTNLLAILSQNPLSFIPKAVVNRAIPKTTEKLLKDLDGTFSNLFGSIMIKFNQMANDPDSNFIERGIGSILGVNSRAKKSIETDKYFKEKMSWNGIAQKTLVEVIPTHLSKIVSLLSGEKEKLYDYNKGKFVDVDTVKQEYEKVKDSYFKSAFSDIISKMDNIVNKHIVFNSQSDKNNFSKDIEKVMKYLYNNKTLMNLNKDNKYEYSKYGVSEENFAIIRGMFKSLPKYMQMEINSRILEERKKQNSFFEDLEKDGNSVFVNLENNSMPNSYIKTDRNTKKTFSVLSNNLVNSVDNYGKNMFYYLRNIYSELSMIRQYGTNTKFSRKSTTKERFENSKLDFEIDDINKEIRFKNLPKEKNIPDIRNILSDKIIKTQLQKDTEKRLRDDLNYRKNTENIIRKNNKNKHFFINMSEVHDNIDELENYISFYTKRDIEERDEIENDLKKRNNKSLIQKLLDAKNLGEKSTVLIEKFEEFSKKPIKFLNETIETVDRRMYEFIYGTKNGKNDIKGFLDLSLNEFKKTMLRFNDFLDDKILEPLKNKFQVESVKDIGGKVLEGLGIDVEGVKSSTSNTFKEIRGRIKEGLFSSFDTVANAFEDVFNKNNRVTNLLQIEKKDDKLANEIYKTPYKSQKKEDIKLSLNNLQRKILQENPKQFFVNQNAYKNRIDNLESGLKSNYNIKKKRELNTVRDLYESNLPFKDTFLNALKEQSKIESINNISDDYINTLYNTLGIDKKNKVLNNAIKDLIITDKNNEDYGNINKLKNTKIEDLYNNIKSKYDNKDGNDILDNIVNYLDTNENSNINFTLDKLVNNMKKRSVGRNTVDLYKEYNNLVGLAIGKDNEEGENERGISYNYDNNSLVPKIDNISNTLENIYNLLKSVHPSNKNNTIGPRIPFSLTSSGNPGIDNHPEGSVLINFAQDLVNWIWNRTGHFNEGGIANDSMLATLSKGEVILSNENVDKLTSIFDDIINNVKERKKAGEFKSSVISSLNHLNLDTDYDDKIELLNWFINKSEKSNTLKKEIRSLGLSQYRQYKKILSNDNNKTDDSNNSGIKLNEIKQEFINDFKTFKDSMFGKTPKEENKKFSKVVNDVVGNFNKYAPDLAFPTIAGAGLSLLTGVIGGPLLGASVGAGLGLLSKSDKMQDWLFGEIDTTGKRSGNGVLNRDLVKFTQKYIPDMKNFGIVGATLGTLTPLGTLGGLLLGGAFGFIKNNNDLSTALFGKNNIFSEENKNKLQKALPKVLGGVVIGNMIGPFGLLGNTLLGTASGLLLSTEEFKTGLFGKYDEKEHKYKNGILPAIRDNFVDPLKDFAKDIKDNFKEGLKENVFIPLKESFSPIKHDIQLFFGGLKDKAEKFLDKQFEKHIGTPLTKIIEDKIVKPISKKAFGLLKFVFSGVGNTLLAPIKAIQNYANKRRKSHIINNNAWYMTAQERLDFAEKEGFVYNNTFDKVLSSMNKQQAEGILNNLNTIDSKYKSSKKARVSLLDELGIEVSKYTDLSNTNKIMKAISKGNLDKALSIVDKQKINDGERNNLTNIINNRFKEYQDIELLKKNSNKAKNDIYNAIFENTGIKVNDSNINHIRKLLEKEIDYKKDNIIKPSTDKKNNISNDSYVNYMETEGKKRYNNIIDILNKAVSVMESIEKNTNENEEDNDRKGLSNGVSLSSDNIISPSGNILDIDKNNDGIIDKNSPDVIRLKNEYKAQYESRRADKEVNKVIEKDKEDKPDYGGFIGKLINGMDSNISKILKGTALVSVGIGSKLLYDNNQGFKKFIDNTVTPWIQDVAMPLIQKGLLGFVQQLPTAIFKSFKYSLTTLLPAFADGVFNLLGINTPKFIQDRLDNAKNQINSDLSKYGISTEDNNTNYESATYTNNDGTTVEMTSDDIYGNFGITKENSIGESILRATSRNILTNGNMLDSKLVSKFDKVVQGASVAKNVVQKNTSIFGKVGKIATAPITAPLTVAKGTASAIYNGNKLINKVGGNTVGKVYEKLDDKLANSSIINNAVESVGKTIGKIFSDSKILKNIPNDICEKIINNLPNSLNGLKEIVEKNAVKTGTRAIAGISTGGLLTIAFAVYDFFSGYNNAKSILKIIDEPSFVMKLSCGIMKSVKNATIIGSLIPDSMFMDWIFGLLEVCGINKTEIQQQREYAKQETEKFKKQNNITGKFDVNDYLQVIKKSNREKNKRDANGDGKVNLLDVPGNIINGVKNTVSSVWNGIKDTTSNVFNGVKTFLFGKGGDNNSALVGRGSSSPQMKNGFAYFNQKDRLWNRNSNDISTSGCGPASIAMILNQKGIKTNPQEIANIGLKTNTWDTNGSRYNLFNTIGERYGININDAGGNFDNFVAMAKAGIPQALSGFGNNGLYTKVGHIVTATGMDNKGNIIINDPNSSSNSKAWSIDKIKNGFNNSWGFGDLPIGKGEGDELIDSNLSIESLMATEVEDNYLRNKIKNISSKFKNIYSHNKENKVSINSALDKFNSVVGLGEGIYTDFLNTIAIGSKQLGGVIPDYEAVFQSSAQEFGIDADLLKAISMQESGGNPNIKKSAWGMMQIENGGTTDEFIKFGKTRNNGPYTAEDRLDPNKAIPFASFRLSNDLKHYNGDYIKTIQAYNFSKYSLDKLIKKFPDTWLEQRPYMGRYNGTNRNGYGAYGDEKYIEHVLRYYHGDRIQGGNGIVEVTGGTGVESISINGQQLNNENETKNISTFFSDLSDLFTNSFNKLWGFDVSTTESTISSEEGSVSNSSLNTNSKLQDGDKPADDWFTSTLGGRMSSPYGMRTHPISKTKKMHNGIDYSAPSDTKIYTPVDGVVKANVKDGTPGWRGYGHTLEIQDALGNTHMYNHLVRQSSLKVGDKVTAGQHVANVGSTGNSTGPHLHFEIQKPDGSRYEPNSYFKNNFTKVSERANKSVTQVNINDMTGIGGPLEERKVKKIEKLEPKQPNVVHSNNSKSNFDYDLLKSIVTILSKISINTDNLEIIKNLLSDLNNNNNSSNYTHNSNVSDINKSTKKYNSTNNNQAIKNSLGKRELLLIEELVKLAKN